MNSTQMFLAQRQRIAESNLRAAAARVPRINDLAELMRASRVSIPPEIRGVVRSLSSYRTLGQAISARAQQLVQADLDQLKALKPVPGQLKEEFAAELRSAYGKLQHQRWAPLRGHEPMVLNRACRNAEQIIAEHLRKMA